MPFEEKATWVSVVIGVLVPVGYFATVLPQLADTPAADIEYQQPLIVAVIASIVLIILGTIAMAIATAVGAEITGTGSVDDIDRKDERDVSISRRGDVVGYYVASAGAVGALILTMLESDYFWIANTLYLSFAVAGLVAGIVKLRAYRRGF
jgi:MFS family permease